MDDLRADLQEIKARNARVEENKAWETSLTRRAFITIMTYCFASVYMMIAGLSNPFLGAIVPASGYLLSTLSLPYVRKFWISKIQNKSV